MSAAQWRLCDGGVGDGKKLGMSRGVYQNEDDENLDYDPDSEELEGELREWECVEREAEVDVNKGLEQGLKGQRSVFSVLQKSVADGVNIQEGQKWNQKL
ncbi:hypothetical protein NDU88_005542 [Pleurodeles waltl]|uniref:Uncharacterized protein n=1 Tax=Pleurodeles waltl TaxID=8319 RepID=A0AAV7NMU8_PLEWA|nr:hypothetical protein NDU88_005542 [Pleurodeles waltl]